MIELRTNWRWELGWLMAGCGVLLVPIWWFGYFVSQDGASHVANADLMRRVLGGRDLFFGQYYFVEKRPLPNLLGHLILMALMGTCSGGVSEKIVASLCVVGMPLGGWYLLRGIREEAGFLAVLLVPLAFGRLFQLGFYNFSLGMGLAFLLVGYWVRHFREPGWGVLGVLFLGSLVVHLAHLFDSAAALGLMGGLGILEIWKSRSREEARKIFWTWGALGAAGVLAIYYSIRLGGGGGGAKASMGDFLGRLATADVLVSHWPRERWVSVVWLAGIVGLAGVGIWRRRGKLIVFDGIWVGVIGMMGLFFMARSERMQALYVPERAMTFGFALLILWLGTVRWGRWVRDGVVVGALLAAVGMVGMDWRVYQGFERNYREMTLVEKEIGRGSVYLPIVYTPFGRDGSGGVLSEHVAGDLHFLDWVAVDRESVDLGNYEARAADFPVRFRDAVNPARRVGGIGGVEVTDTGLPAPTIGAYLESGGRVDYVVVVGMTQEQRKDAGAVVLYQDLEKYFQKVDLGSTELGVEVWKYEPGDPPAASATPLP